MSLRYWLRQFYATVFLYAAPVAVAAWLWLNGAASLSWWLGAAAVTAALTVYGYNVGSHYAFAHRLFRFPRPVELALIYTSTLSACASPLSWAIYHLAHHRYADTEHDPHSPEHRGLQVAFACTFRSDKADPWAARHLFRDPAQRFADSDFGFWAITLSWPALVWLVGGVTGLVYLWLIPVWYVLAVALAFVLCHVGPRDEQSGSRAINHLLLGLLSFGDGDHLQHHRNMKSCGRWTRVFATAIGGR